MCKHAYTNTYICSPPIVYPLCLSPMMYTVVFAIIADAPTSVQTIFVPFRLWLTDPIFKVDVSGVLPSSDVLKKVNSVEFTTTTSGFLIVDERVRVIRPIESDPLFVSVHVRKWSDVVHVTSRLSSTWHTAALGDGDMAK